MPNVADELEPYDFKSSARRFWSNFTIFVTGVIVGMWVISEQQLWAFYTILVIGAFRGLQVFAELLNYRDEVRKDKQ